MLFFSCRMTAARLQAHAGVHAGGGQRSSVALRVLVELHEHQVPKLDESLAVAVGVAAGNLAGRSAVPLLAQQGGEDIHLHHPAFVAALLHAAVVVDFRAGAGWAFSACRAPPVVLVAVAVDALHRNAYLIVPDVKGLIVIQVDGHVEAVGREAEELGHQFPGKADGSVLEVVADAEVAQHLEESQVLVVAHLVYVGGAETLLAAGKAAGGRSLLAHKEGLERHHAGAGEEQRGVASGNEGSRGHVLMPFVLEESYERIPDLVSVHSL